jgi:hypothetical protein
MGFLSRFMGREPDENEVQPGVDAAAQVASNFVNRGRNKPAGSVDPEKTASNQSIPPERLGLRGEYDENGLAKRVALAFDRDPILEDVDTLYVAQTETTVVLRGSVPNRDILNRMVMVAREVHGTGDVETDQVKVG